MSRRPWWHASVDWTAVTDWWADPALAYLAGLQHGVQLERDRQWTEADQVHREAVERALDFIAVCEERDRWPELKRRPRQDHVSRDRTAVRDAS